MIHFFKSVCGNDKKLIQLHEITAKGKIVLCFSLFNLIRYLIWSIVAVEILYVYLQPIRDREDTILLYKALTQLAIVSLLV